MSKCLFKKELRYVSYDMGNSWQATGESRKGSLIAQGSSLCLEPYKFQATYSGGTTYSAECDSNTTLSSGDTAPSGYQYTRMTSAIIGDCITSIDLFAFSQCESLTNVTIPNSVTSIGVAAFNSCFSLAAIDIPSGLTSIAEGAFYQCISLSNITIPSGVTSIGNMAFTDCESLTSVTIPSGVTNIGQQAFYYCLGLQSITCLATTPPTLGSSAFAQTHNVPIYVPATSVNTYKSAWSDYSSRIQAIP